MKINAYQLRIIAYLIIPALCIWMGRLSIQYQIHKELEPLQEITEINKTIPLVDIEGIEGAQLIGTVNHADIRIKSGNEVTVPDQDLSFQLDLQHLGFLGERRAVIQHSVPEWAQFVASKNGKYFYQVDEKQAKRLSVPNRLYFKTREEAEEAGYLPRG